MFHYVHTVTCSHSMSIQSHVLIMSIQSHVLIMFIQSHVPLCPYSHMFSLCPYSHMFSFNVHTVTCSRSMSIQSHVLIMSRQSHVLIMSIQSHVLIMSIQSHVLIQCPYSHMFSLCPYSQYKIKLTLHDIGFTLDWILLCKVSKCRLIFTSWSLAHLSTKCSSELLWSFNVRRPSSVRACVRASTISLNNISSETASWILTKLHRNDPWVVLYQSCSNRSSWLHK